MRPLALAALCAALLVLGTDARAQTTVTRAYTYADTHLGVTQLQETTSDGVSRTTTTTYAHQTSGMTGMKDKNMLAQTYSVTVTNGATDVESKAWTVFALSGGHWRPSEAWAWTGSGDGTTNDTSAPAAHGGSETVRTARISAYDSYGRPTALLDTRGNTTSFAYGASNTGAFLTRVTLPAVGGIAQTTDYGYDDRGRLTSATDANGAVTSYRYDTLGRLDRVRTPETPTSAWTTEIAYGYGTAGQPNWIRTRAYAASGTYAETVAYSDGLGRALQTQLKEGTGYIVAAQTYDALGRPDKTYLPYRRTASAASYDAAFATNAAAYYDGSPGPNATGRPYAETSYLDDPTGRPLRAIGEGNTASLATTIAYGTTLLGGQTRRYTETADETNRKTRTYADALGRTVATTAGFGAPEAATTSFSLDVLDRATATTAPEGQVTTATFDPLGRPVKTVSPDAGTTLAKYDHAGALRFRQDAVEAGATGTADDRAFYTEVDALGRPTETGQGAATGSGSPTWASLSGAAATPTTLRTAANQLSATAYDQKPATTAAPWSHFAAQINALPASDFTYAKGRPSGTVSKASDGAWQAEVYSYDREGRVVKSWIYTTDATSTVQPALNTTYTYTYDWQGRPLTTARTVGTASFYQWYDYNATGQLTQVRHNTSASRPASAQVTYSYDARGARASYQYTGGPSVPIAYTARGWLDRIGDPASTAYPFSERRTYLANGLVATAEAYNAAVPASPKRYRFNMGASGYDALGRLRSATYEGYLGGTFFNDIGENSLSSSYDRNGNLKTLNRKDGGGEFVDNLTYTYTAGTNRLASVADPVPSNVATWDADAGSFTYDRNGNALSLAPVGTTLAYDWRNLPRTATKSGVTTTYRYSAGGQRYWSKTGSNSAEYVALDGATVAGRFTVSSTGSVTAWDWNVLAGGAVVGRQPHSNDARYLHADALGSVRAVTSGTTVVEARDYDPWGLEMAGRVTTSGAKSREGYTGHDLDAETGLNYAHARYYSAALGRFTSTDPHATSYPGWSPYHYAANNPISITDPTGMDWYSQTDGEGWTHYKWFEGDGAQKDWTHVGATHSYQDASGYTVRLGDGGADDWAYDATEVYDAVMSGALPSSAIIGNEALPLDFQMAAMDAHMELSGQAYATTVLNVASYGSMVFGGGAIAIRGLSTLGHAARTGVLARQAFLSENFGVTSRLFAHSATTQGAGGHGLLNVPGSLFKAGWSSTGRDGGGMVFRVGIGRSSVNPNNALFHPFQPRWLQVPKSFANPSVALKRALSAM